MQAQQRTAYVQAQGDQGQRQPVARARECLLCGTQAMVVYGEGGPSVAQLRLPQPVGGDLWQLAGSAGQPHQPGRASRRESVCQYGELSVVPVSVTPKKSTKKPILYT